MTLASSSRDSTVRIWSLLPLFHDLYLSALVGRGWDVVAPPAYKCNPLEPGCNPLLAGRRSREMKLQCEERLALATNCNTPSAITDHKYYQLQNFSKFYEPPCGVNNLHDLLTVICNKERVTPLSSSYKHSIKHWKHLSSYTSSEAQVLEVGCSRSDAGVGKVSKEERLLEAATKYISSGNLYKYCELMIQLNQWQKALSVSPGVSMHYWKSLMKKYVDHLLKSSNLREATPYCVASRHLEELAAAQIQAHHLQDAFLTSVVCEEVGGGEKGDGDGGGKEAENGLEEKSVSSQLVLCANKLADTFYTHGQPVLAACYHIATDQHILGMSKLLRGNELYLALFVGDVLTMADVMCEKERGGSEWEEWTRLRQLTTHLLIKRAERLGNWSLGVELSRSLPCSETTKQQLYVSFSGSLDEVDSLHAEVGIPSSNECLTHSSKLQSTLPTHPTLRQVEECVGSYLLSLEPNTGLQLGLDHIKGVLSSQSDWSIHSLWPVHSLMCSVRGDLLIKEHHLKLRNDMLVMSSYLGSMKALQFGYISLVPHLLQHTKILLTKHECDVLLTPNYVHQICEHFDQLLSSNGPISVGEELKEFLFHASCRVNEGSSSKFEFQSCLSDRSWVEVESGEDMVQGSSLPSHGDQHVSFLTGKKIMGPCFPLEDGTSYLSLNESLMWAKVNPFSPLGSGMKINPF